MSFSRTVQPELLDTLPPDHPDAKHSRRDLRLINRIMGNHRWIERVLPPLLREGETVLELGAGEGELAQRLAQRGVPVDAVDRAPAPAHWPASRAWHCADLKTFSRYDRYPVVIGNLIFHHLSDAELGEFGRTLRRHARVIVACEPGRSRASQIAFRIFGTLLGASRVTHHDAIVSIRAGFRGQELAEKLGLSSSEWDVHCTVSPIGSYRLIAVRHP